MACRWIFLRGISENFSAGNAKPIYNIACVRYSPISQPPEDVYEINKPAGIVPIKESLKSLDEICCPVARGTAMRVRDVHVLSRLRIHLFIYLFILDSSRPP
jgi:hypothetical protein